MTVYLLACHTRTLMAGLVWWPTHCSRSSRAVYLEVCTGPPTSPPPRRSAPPGGLAVVTGTCCYASAEELADGQQQTGKRQHDEYHLVDMVLARRQSAHQVYYPENRIKPQRKPRPPFPP